MAGDRRLAARTSIACARPDRFSDWRAEGLRWPAGSRASVRARPASSRRLPCGNRSGPAASSRIGGVLRRQVHRDEAARRQAAWSFDARRRALRLRNRLGAIGRVVEGHPRRAIRRVALGHAGRDGRVLERQPPVRVESRIDDRVHRGQIEAGDLVAALDQHVAQVLLGRRVAELAGVDRRRISSSVNAATRRAAQNASSSRSSM